MASSEVEVVNYALSLLGEGAITSLTDNSETARVMNLKLSLVRDALFRLCQPSFARKRSILVPTSNTPAFQWDFEYQLPVDRVAIVSIDEYYLDAVYDGGFPFEIEGDKLLTNISAEIKLRYIFKETNVVKWDPLFVRLIGTALAMESAYDITGSNTNLENINGLYERSLRESRAADGREQHNMGLNTNAVHRRF